MVEPVSTDEAKSHLRVDSAIDNDLIAENIVAAREWVENETGLILTRRVVTERLSRLSGPARLRAWPVAPAEPVAVSYRDAAGAEHPVIGAVLLAAARPAAILPAAGTRWPAVPAIGGDINVTFTAGYADPDAIPRVLRLAMRVMLTAFYEDREGGELFAAAERSARSLCRRYKRRIL